MKLQRFLKYTGKKILLHGILWMAVLFFYTFFFGVEGTTFKTVFQFSIFLLPVTLGTTYTFVYYLIPKFLLPRKYLLFTFYSISTFIISGVYIIISTFYGLVFLLQLKISSKFPISKSVLFIMIAVYLVVLLVSAFTLLKNYYQSLSTNEELKNSVLEGKLQLKEQQLQYLKMQIHPHFLFNTLNTLYAFALNKNENTPKMILQLSNLLDYILYQTQKPLVFLSEEIEHLIDYIDLEKNRFQDKLQVNFETKSINDFIQIPPMLFLPFVENSFKHGKDATGNLKIDILIMSENGQLIFEITNSKGILEMDTNKNNSDHGIGLENIQKRLDLLYKDNYSLKIIDSEDQYQVKLILNLNTTE